MARYVFARTRYRFSLVWALALRIIPRPEPSIRRLRTTKLESRFQDGVTSVSGICRQINVAFMD